MAKARNKGSGAKSAKPARSQRRKKASAKKTARKKASAKKTARKKAPAKKAVRKKAPAKKTARKKAPAKKVERKKAPAKKVERIEWPRRMDPIGQITSLTVLRNGQIFKEKVKAGARQGYYAKKVLYVGAPAHNDRLTLADEGWTRTGEKVVSIQYQDHRGAWSHEYCDSRTMPVLLRRKGELVIENVAFRKDVGFLNQ